MAKEICRGCMGRNRYTTDMVCMDCGRDYMPDDGSDVSAPGLGWKRLMGLWREQCKKREAALEQIEELCKARCAANPFAAEDGTEHHMHPTWILVSDVRNAAKVIAGDTPTDLAEQGRRLATRREDLIAAGADPRDLAVPLYPVAGDTSAVRAAIAVDPECMELDCGLSWKHSRSAHIEKGSGMSEDLQEQLRRVLNGYEEPSNTPDYILASYVRACLHAFNAAVVARDGWYGIAPAPGWHSIDTPPPAPDPDYLHPDS